MAYKRRALVSTGKCSAFVVGKWGCRGGVQLSNFRFLFSRFFGFLPPPFRRHCHCHCRRRRRPSPRPRRLKIPPPPPPISLRCRRYCRRNCCRRHPRRHYEGGSLASPDTYVRRLTHVAATAAAAARRPAFAACKCPAPRTSLRYRRYCRRKCCRHRPRRHYAGGSLASSRSQIGESTQPRRRG